MAVVLQYQDVKGKWHSLPDYYPNPYMAAKDAKGRMAFWRIKVNGKVVEEHAR